MRLRWMGSLLCLMAPLAWGCASDSMRDAGPGAGWLELGDEHAASETVTARLGERTLGPRHYMAIRLTKPDGGTLEILRESFAPGTYPAGHRTAGTTLVSFSRGVCTRIYMAENLELTIDSASPDEVIGSLDGVLRDMAASCMYCPGTTEHVRGAFHAVRTGEP